MFRVVFTARPNVFSRLIRWLTKSPVSHVFLEYDSAEWKIPLALEAHGLQGVRLVPAHRARLNVVAEFQANLDPDAIFKLQRYIGESFDYAGILKFMLVILARRVLRLQWRQALTSTDSQMCSELVARLFMSLGLVETDRWQVELTSPKRLWKYCRRHQHDLFKLTFSKIDG